MKLEYRRVEDAEARMALGQMDGWHIENGELAREFRFDTYKDGLVFAVAVGYLADRLNHHPDLFVGYAKVRVSMHTHDVGGLSPYDFELARQISKL